VQTLPAANVLAADVPALVDHAVRLVEDEHHLGRVGGDVDRVRGAQRLAAVVTVVRTVVGVGQVVTAVVLAATVALAVAFVVASVVVVAGVVAFVTIGVQADAAAGLVLDLLERVGIASSKASGKEKGGGQGGKLGVPRSRHCVAPLKSKGEANRAMRSKCPKLRDEGVVSGRSIDDRTTVL